MMGIAPPAFAAIVLPSSTQTVSLQSLSSNETSFILPGSSLITTAQGDGLVGDGASRWQLLLQGVVNAAGDGISFTSSGTQIATRAGSSVTGLVGINLASNNNTLLNNGTIVGTGGTAISLNGADNTLRLGSGSVIKGDILSAGSGNILLLSGVGEANANIGGATGFDAIDVGGRWVLGGDVLLSSVSGSALTVEKGGILVLPGSLYSYNNQTSGVNIEPGGSLQVGAGGTTGDVKIPVLNNGVLVFYRSDTKFNLNTAVSGDGVLIFRGTGVSGESSYILSSNSNSFTGSVVIENGARLQVKSSDPAPRAKIVVQNGGTLWLGSSANFTTPLLLEGDGWPEGGGPYGALRLDSDAIQAGAITLTGNARIGAVYSDYIGTISGAIGDDGNGYQLVKTGGGLIILSGDNTWTGGMLLNEGRVSVSADDNLGAQSGVLTFNGGTLEMTQDFLSRRAIVVDAGGGATSSTGTNTFAGGTSGSGSLTLNAGKLVLAGNDTRTGSTTINSGATLQIGSDAVNGANQGTLSGNVNNAGSLIFNRSGSSTYAGVLSGSGSLSKQNDGVVTLSGAGSSQGNVTVNGGTLAFSPAGAFNSTGNFTTASGAKTSVAAGSTLNITGQLLQQGAAIFESSLNAAQPAATATTIGLSGALALTGAPGSASSIIGKTLNVLHSTTSSGITGDFTSIGFSNPADYLVITGGKANNNQDYNLDFGLRWLAGPAEGNGTFTLINPADTFDVDVALANQSGPFASGWDGQSLTKGGSGTLLLSAKNTYTGRTLVNGGTLQTNTADALADSSSVTVASGATLALNNFDQRLNNLSGAGTLALGSATLTANGQADTNFSGSITGSGKLVKEGAAALTLSGNSSFSGGTIINAGTLVATAGAALGVGDIVNGAIMTLDFATVSRVQNLISGSGVLNKAGAGIATLQKNGSSAGEVNVNQGALNLAHNVSFTSSGDVNTAAGAFIGVGDSGALNVANRFDLQGGLAVVPGQAQPIVTADNALLGAGSSLNIAGINFHQQGTAQQFAGQTFLVMSTASPGGIDGDFSALRIGGATSRVDYAEVEGFKDALSQNYSAAVRLTWYAAHSSTPEKANGVFTLATPQESFYLSAPLLDQAANPATGWDGKTLTKAGEGTLTLAKHNLFTGPTLINGGTLQAGIDNALTQSSEVRIASGATLALDGFDQAINNLSGGGNVELGSATLRVNNDRDTALSGAVFGSGDVIKAGPGTLQLLADQSYTGTTTLSGGTLAIGSQTAAATLASSQVNIASGTVFGGYGGAVGNVDNQGMLAVADALPQFAAGPAGNFTVGGNLTNAGNIVMASPAPASVLTVNGNYIGNNGLLTLSTVLGGDGSATDRLVILGDSSGSTRVKINNAGGSGALTNRGIEIISVAGQSSGRFTLDGRVVAGAYDYFLQQGMPGDANGNWYLRSQQPAPPTPEPSPAPQVVRPEAGSYLANLAAANTLFTQSLSDRAGRAEDSTLWLRQFGSRTGFYDGSGQLKTSVNSYMVQGGGELAQGQFADDDRLGVGVMFGYANAQSHTDANRSGYSSKGKLDGYSAGLYGTWYQDGKNQQGAYVDTWLQYSWFKAQVNGEQIAQQNYDINGFSGSVESGYRMGLSQSESGGVYLTPQAQLIWQGAQADDVREQNGTEVSADGRNNLQSRLGVKLSRDGVSSRDKTSGRLFTTYVETNWLHNTRPVGISLDDESVGVAGTRNVGEIKLGIEGRLSDRLNLWGNVSTQMGGSGYSAVAGVVGGSYRF